jgi:Uma2 family endonuclease
VSEGIFQDERGELVRGIVVQMSPIGPAHANPVDVLTETFVSALQGRARVRIQQPFVAVDESEPEPDVTIVPPASYAERHPDTAWLVVEVAESSLDHDRSTKAPLYAESGVPEYWIVDVNAQAVEVHDLPATGHYGRVRTFRRGETLAPARFPDVTVAVDRLFE